MATERIYKTYTVTTGVNDGYVVHGVEYFYDSDDSLLIGYDDYYDEGYCDTFISLTNINIPKNATIVNAVLKLNVYQVVNGYVNSQIKINTNYTIPVDYATFATMTGTTNYINFHQDITPTEQYVSYNATDVIQEVVNREDWTIGNTFTFFTENTTYETSDSMVDIDSYEYNPIVELQVTYELSDEYTLSDVLKGSRVESFEYELLHLQNDNYEHKSNISNYIKSADIKIDFSRNIIGNASFEINDEADIDYISDLIKIYYNVSNKYTSFTIPLGVYCLNSPNRTSDSKTVHRNVTAYDLLYILEQDKTTTAMTFPSGTNVVDAVEILLDSVGSWVKYNIEDSSQTLSEDMSYTLGKSKLVIINDLLNTINYYPLWVTGNGIFRAIPWTNIKKTTWDFIDNTDSLYSSGISVTMDYSESYNKVIVVTNETTADTDPLTSTVTFEDLGIGDDVPFSYTNTGYYKTLIINTEAVTQTYVDAIAERELYKMLEINESIELSHAFVTSRNNDGLPYQGDHFYFKNELLNLEEYYKIESMSYSLKTGNLVSTTIRRVANVY